ncbi:hypothetical protein [Mailhella massiliensis]|uniref:hypothetical protein n=1 Tax=Mailhella massiliensis TaxID=1903261 RepID=UPI00118719C2|nr:hypothetical protein [Mailhella massiliensis]
MAVRIYQGSDGNFYVDRPPQILGRPKNSFYTGEEVMDFFQIGPRIFSEYLNKYNDIIMPVFTEGNNIVTAKYDWIEVRDLDLKIREEKERNKTEQIDLDVKTLLSRISDLEAENAKLRAEMEELKKTTQSDGVVEKSLGSRERKTLLKIMRACLDERKQPIERGLAGKLARRIEDLYGDEGPNEDTIKIKLNEMENIPIYKS